MVLVYFRPLFLILLVQIVLDGFGSNRGLADRRGQQVRTYDIAGGEVPGPVGHLVELIAVDQVALVGVVFHTAHVAALADCGHDHVALNGIFLAAFDGEQCQRAGSGEESQRGE